MQPKLSTVSRHRPHDAAVEVRSAPATLPMAFAVVALLCAGDALAAQPLAEVASPGAARDHAGAWRSDTTDIVLAPKGDASRRDKTEHMVRMKAGDILVYAWEAPGATDLWHEFHGHAAQTVTFYKKAEGARHAGSLIAPFDGHHGWYLENRTDKPVTVRMRVSGFYEPAAD